MANQGNIQFCEGVKSVKIIPETNDVLVKDIRSGISYILQFDSVKNMIEFSNLSHKFKIITDKLTSREVLILNFERGAVYAVKGLDKNPEDYFFEDELSKEKIQETYDSQFNVEKYNDIGSEVREKYGLKSMVKEL